jgi:hypothetical protein
MASATQRRVARKKAAQKAVAKRARRRDADPLYDPSAQLSGNQLALASGRLTDLEFKPREQALDEQSKTATTQGTALAARSQDYYRKVAEDAAAAVANQNAIRDRLSGGLAQIGTEAQTRNDTAAKTAADASAADATLRGQGLSGGGDVKTAQELAIQKSLAAAAAGSSRSAGELQSGNYAGLQASIQGSSALRGGEAQTSLLNRLANQQATLRQQKADLSSQRGAAKEKNLLDLRQQGFENAVTVQGLGIKREDLAAQTANQQAQIDAADRKQTAAEKHNAALEAIANRNADTSAGRLATAQEQDAYKRAHHLGPYKLPTTKKGKQPAAVRATKIKGRTQIGQARLAYTRSGGNYDAYLKNAPKDFPLPVLHAGYELAHQGYIGPNTIRGLKALGITVPSAWTRKPKARPGTAGSIASAISGAVSTGIGG